MAKELGSIDVSKLPDLLRIVEEVRRSGRPRMLERNGEQLAVVVPVESIRSSKRRTGVITPDDPLVRMIGAGSSGIPGGISGRKYEHFERAFRSEG